MTASENGEPLFESLLVGEPASGKKLHAVAPGAVDGSWRQALCGVSVIVYAHIRFADQPTWARCRRCEQAAQPR